MTFDEKKMKWRTNLEISMMHLLEFIESMKFKMRVMLYYVLCCFQCPFHIATTNIVEFLSF